MTLSGGEAILGCNYERSENIFFRRSQLGQVDVRC